LQGLLRPPGEDHVDYFCLHHFCRGGCGNHLDELIDDVWRYKEDEAAISASLAAKLMFLPVMNVQTNLSI
jgi:hypothetical protein